MDFIKAWLLDLKDVFLLCFIDDGRWKWLVEGFVNSIIITVFAIIIGLVFGIVLGAIRS